MNGMQTKMPNLFWNQVTAFAVPDTQPASSSFCEEYVQIGEWQRLRDKARQWQQPHRLEVESADEETAPPPSKRPCMTPKEDILAIVKKDADDQPIEKKIKPTKIH